MHLEWVYTRYAVCNRHESPSAYPSQVPTGRRPFHHLRALKSDFAVLRGERPTEHLGAESLGFSGLSGLVEQVGFNPTDPPTAA